MRGALKVRNGKWVSVSSLHPVPDKDMLELAKAADVHARRLESHFARQREEFQYDHNPEDPVIRIEHFIRHRVNQETGTVGMFAACQTCTRKYMDRNGLDGAAFVKGQGVPASEFLGSMRNHYDRTFAEITVGLAVEDMRNAGEQVDLNALAKRVLEFSKARSAREPEADFRG